LKLSIKVAAAIAVASLAIAGCATASSSQDDVLKGGLFGPAMSPAEMEKAIAAAAAHPLGSEQNPVRVNMPPGERGYLERLRCSDGNAPAFERGGSVGTGPFGNILDVYDVRCLTGTPATSSVYMDMYHGDYVESRAVPGFSIKAP
jgi:hypothetical protein